MIRHYWLFYYWWWPVVLIWPSTSCYFILLIYSDDDVITWDWLTLFDDRCHLLTLSHPVDGSSDCDDLTDSVLILAVLLCWYSYWLLWYSPYLRWWHWRRDPVGRLTDWPDVSMTTLTQWLQWYNDIEARQFCILDDLTDIVEMTLSPIDPIIPSIDDYWYWWPSLKMMILVYCYWYWCCWYYWPWRPTSCWYNCYSIIDLLTSILIIQWHIGRDDEILTATHYWNWPKTWQPMTADYWRYYWRLPVGVKCYYWR